MCIRDRPTPQPTPSANPSTPELSATGVAAGGTVRIKGGGFAADEDLEVTLHSDPVTLGNFSAEADGSYVATLRIPADTTPGAHRIEVRGLESGAVVSVPLTVLAAGSPSTGVRDLAATGSNALAIGIPLALGGAALLSLIHISEPTRLNGESRIASSA